MSEPTDDFYAAIPSRLSCADSTFPKLSHAAALSVITDLGIPAVDICVFEGYPHCPPEAVVDDPLGTADSVRRRVDRAGLVVADVFAILGNPLELSSLAVNSPDSETRKRALEMFQGILAFAKALGAPGITLLPGSVFEGVDPDQCLRLSAQELQKRAEMAAEAGLALSVEAHYQSVAETPKLAQHLLEMAPDLQLTLDHGHFVYQGFTQDEIDVLLPRTRHVQVRQAAPGDMQRPARKGAIDYGLMLKRLAAARYKGYIGLEYQWDEWMDFNRVDCISETAELRDVILEHARAAQRQRQEAR